MPRANVFVSHSSADNEFTKALVDELKSRGLTVWVDLYELATPGDAFPDEVVAAIEASTHFVLLLSAKAAESPVVRQEFHKANTYGRDMIPVIVPGQPEFERFKQHAWIDLGLRADQVIPMEDVQSAADGIERRINKSKVDARPQTPRRKQLSYNDIRIKLNAFVAEYKDETVEQAESQSFWTDLLECYGVRRRGTVSFERHARRASTGNTGRIDVFWPGTFIGEQKSAGKLDIALGQALDYIEGGSITAAEMPKYAVGCDFQQITVKDLDTLVVETVALVDLPRRPELLGWLAGYERQEFTDRLQESASVEAAALMGRLYAELTVSTPNTDPTADEESDPNEDDEVDRDVSILLTRLLFLMFGDDAGLWDRSLFERFIVERTTEDGSDVGSQLVALFQVLNTPEERRSQHMDEALRGFPYVNGAIFADAVTVPFFNGEMRDALLDACAFDWTAISPAVFGSLFQTIKSRDLRRVDGEHYTTEENILKTLRPLFLDEYREALAKAWNRKADLRRLHQKLGDLRYMDPACGCGNFLVVAYREMRKLELDLLVRLKELEGTVDLQELDGSWGLRVTLDQFYGIEINWWPAKIAETAMFLVDHQANREMALALGPTPNRLPIKITAHIHHRNALTADWSEILEPTDSTYVFGNPPFLGHASRNEDQANELRAAWHRSDISRLDYVTAWYAKSLEYFSSVNGEWAFVSTNSITQGDPVPHLFEPILAQHWTIKFAHTTFPWTSEAPGKAAVHCVIVGFTRIHAAPRKLFSYNPPALEPVVERALNINAYLVNGPNVFVSKRSTAISTDLPEASFGSMPRDGGNLIVEQGDYEEVAADPVAAKYLRPFRGAREILHNEQRWCLWLTELDPGDLSRSDVLRSRVTACRDFREQSRAASTRSMASTPHLFGQRPLEMTNPYLCIPRVVSENRLYFTAARLSPDIICSDATFMVLDPDGLMFSIISSSMFITWQRTVGGRLKSDLRFSSTIVWNNLPLPSLEFRIREKIIQAGRAVLAVRALHPDRSLAEQYNPLAMDPQLIKAHDALDTIVDKAFGAARRCTTEAQRQRILFARYQELTESVHEGE